MFSTAEARRKYWQVVDTKKQNEDWTKWESMKEDFEKEAKRRVRRPPAPVFCFDM